MHVTEGSGFLFCITLEVEPSLSSACEFCPASLGGGAVFYQAAADKKLQALVNIRGACDVGSLHVIQLEPRKSCLEIC